MGLCAQPRAFLSLQWFAYSIFLLMPSECAADLICLLRGGARSLPCCRLPLVLGALRVIATNALPVYSPQSDLPNVGTYRRRRDSYWYDIECHPVLQFAILRFPSVLRLHPVLQSAITRICTMFCNCAVCTLFSERSRLCTMFCNLPGMRWWVVLIPPRMII